MAAQVLTVSEDARQSNSTYRKVKTLCEDGILPAYRTKGGHWRIFVRDNFVSREAYEEALREISNLKSKLKSVSSISENN